MQQIYNINTTNSYTDTPTIYKKGKLILNYNDITKKYILETNNGILVFDKIIGYYNNVNINNKEITPTLLCINNSKIINYELDDVFRNSHDLFDKLENIIINKLDLKSETLVKCEEEHNFKRGTCILKYYSNDKKFLLKLTSGILLFDKIIGYYNKDNQQNYLDNPVIICEHDSNLLYYNVDDVFTYADELWKKINQIIYHEN